MIFNKKNNYCFSQSYGSGVFQSMCWPVISYSHLKAIVTQGLASLDRWNMKHQRTDGILTGAPGPHSTRGGHPPHNRQSSDTSGASRDSPQFSHCPPGDSVRFRELRVQSYKTAPRPCTHFRLEPGDLCFQLTSHRLFVSMSPGPLTGSKSEVPRTPSLGAINLLD